MKYRIPVTIVLVGEVLVEAHNFDDAKEEAIVAAWDEWRDMTPNEVSIQFNVSQDQCLQDARRE